MVREKDIGKRTWPRSVPSIAEVRSCKEPTSEHGSLLLGRDECRDPEAPKRLRSAKLSELVFYIASRRKPTENLLQACKRVLVEDALRETNYDRKKAADLLMIAGSDEYKRVAMHRLVKRYVPEALRRNK